MVITLMVKIYTRYGKTIGVMYNKSKKNKPITRGKGDRLLW